MKVSCLILTYNEEDRIRLPLTHALKWADEVIVADKNSGDNTRDIAEGMGAKVFSIPFSPQGHEKHEQFVGYAKNDWVWGFTPGEVPTKEMIEAGLSMVGEARELIMIPHKYYSFGIHHRASPWSISYQPRLYNRSKVTFTGVAHEPIRANKVEHVPYSDTRYVLHQTHASAPDFMRSHADYMINEAQNGEPKAVIKRALDQLSAWDSAWKGNQELFPQAMGWKLYWLGVALHAWERENPETKQQYHKRALDLLDSDWLAR